MAYFDKLQQTSKQVGMLMADFQGLDKLDELVRKTLDRLIMTNHVQSNAGHVQQGHLSLQQFDGWFSELVRKELGRTLAIVRAKAKQKAATTGRAGSASSGVTWHQAREGNRGYVGINSHRGRISSRRRIVPEPTGGKSGIRRHRDVSDRTKQINEYFGPDRHFILRFLEFGTDVRTAKPSGPTGNGSKATYGRRGSIAPRSFFHTVQSDMEQAAQQLGGTLIENVEKWIDTQFTEDSTK